jgi:predicted signal transduction protein with EAL and GGDEF domain
MPTLAPTLEADPRGTPRGPLAAALAWLRRLGRAAPPAPRAAGTVTRAVADAPQARGLRGLSRHLRQLDRRERQLAEALQLAGVGHWSWRPGRDAPEASADACALLPPASAGWSPLRRFLRAVPPTERLRLRAALRVVLDAPGQQSLEHRLRAADGEERVVVHRIASQRDGDGLRLIGTLQDITEHKRAEDGAQRLALFDALTELPNRRFFKHHVHRAVERARRGHGAVAVMFIDLDEFKRINDTLGHGVGDALLREASERLVQCVRGGDVVGRGQPQAGDAGNLVARLGGDEFTVLLTDVRAPTDAARVARRVIAAIGEPILANGHELFVTASVGMAVFPADGDDVDELLAHADAAMYEAKRLGKNTFQFYTAELHALAHEKMLLERELRHAIERQQFELYYQPKVDARTGALAGLEALLRWRHPEWGMVPPARFIPLAEELGIIVPIGDWVLQAACRQLSAWRKAGLPPVDMAINMAPPSFRKPHLPAQVAAECERWGIEPSSLVIEVTEGLLMHDNGATLAILQQLRDLGVRLAVDDFGTGYSSLNYLQRLPISQIKIDQSFVRDVLDNPGHAAITHAIISLAHALGLETVAEGVETSAQARMLMRLGCDVMQGFFYSRPLPCDEIEKLLDASSSFLGQVQDTTTDAIEFA